jgi:hypothetical protein
MSCMDVYLDSHVLFLSQWSPTGKPVVPL